MKNIVSIDTKVKCRRCNIKGFFAATYHCPRCDYFMGYEYSNSINKDIYDEFKEDDIRNQFIFCEKCCIVFKNGCKHMEGGCDDQVENAHFISKYEYEGNVYTGMPLFENEDEWIKEAPKIKVLEIFCSNKGIDSCSKASYPKDKYPQYYEDCDLY
jgi:hypothetical protein